MASVKRQGWLRIVGRWSLVTRRFLARRADVVRRALALAVRSAQSMPQALLNLAAPPRCVACGGDLDLDEHSATTLEDHQNTHSSPICSDCLNELQSPADRYCLRCGNSVDSPIPTDDCPWCRRHRLAFDATYFLGEYFGPVRELVLRTKRRGSEHLARALGMAAAEHSGDRLSRFRPTMVVPVPMYWRRELWRGTNNAASIAHGVAMVLNLPVCHPFQRVVCTQPQMDLPPGQRFRNVRNAFRLKPSYDLAGQRVLLVDDILTTGATCSELARLLKKAGAAGVGALVVGRAEERSRG